MRVLRCFGLPLVLQLAVLSSFIACGGSDKGDDDDTDGSGKDVGGAAATDTLRVVFSPVYSAYIPNHDTSVPVIVDGKTGATFTADDPSLVDIDPSAEGAILRIKKAGSTTIRAKVGTETGSAKLTVEAFTEAEWEAGNMRYNSGNALGLPEAGPPMGPPMGAPMGGMVLNISPDTACAACHGMASEIGDIFGADIEHTPQQTGGYSTQELINIFTMAKKPTGVGQHTTIPAAIWLMFHKWNVTEDEKRGIVAYLRALTPKSQGMLDFPRFGPGGPGGRDGGAGGVVGAGTDGGIPMFPRDGGAGGDGGIPMFPPDGGI